MFGSQDISIAISSKLRSESLFVHPILCFGHLLVLGVYRTWAGLNIHTSGSRLRLGLLESKSESLQRFNTTTGDLDGEVVSIVAHVKG